jgi:hypothetical protein
MPRRLSDASDSDWGEDADSGKSIQPENFPNSVAPNEPEYDIRWIDVEEEGDFAHGTIPFLVDMGARKIFLAPEGSLHAQIMQAVGGEVIGPLNRGYVSQATGDVKIPMCSEKDYEQISDALKYFIGRPKFGRLDKDPHVCPECDELYENCKCLSWGEGADWASDPIDQSSIREMKPGIQAARKQSSWEEFTGYVPTQLMTELQELDRFGEDKWKDVDELKDDIAQNGIQEPIWVEFNEFTGEAHVGEGHHRIGIAEQLGLTSVPVVVVRSSRKPNRPNNHRFQYVGPYHDPEGNPTPPQYMHPSDIGLPVVGERTASRKTSLYMFHVSPSINRDLIASEGLNGQERGLEESGIDSPWTYKTWDQPPGNYFFPSKQDAYAYVLNLNQNRAARPEVLDQTGREFDIYQVDVDGLPMFTDPEAQIISGEGPSNLGELDVPPEHKRVYYNGMWFGNPFGDPARAVTPSEVSPRRIRLIDTMSKENSPDYWKWESDGMPDNWERLPMTEVPWPGHDLSPQEKAGAWDKPLAKLSPRESSYVLGHAESN